VQLTTSDGHVLDRRSRPPAGGDDIAGASCSATPIPSTAATGSTPWSTALFERLPIAGFAALRFDFRREFAGGVDERLDVVAALDHLDTDPSTRRGPRDPWSATRSAPPWP
jgi:alpha/beta superfamily hydrolase